MLDKIICLMGPTASGKTALAIELTKRFPCDIISVDSGMIYRGMDVGTAKPTEEELLLAPHHLINICDPSENYSAGQFRIDAIKAIEEIHAQNRIPLLVGGTMLYFRVLQQGISNLPQANRIIREKLTAEAAEYGWQALYERLQQIDSATASRISGNDTQRLQRALELYEITGKSMSELCREDKPQALPYESLNLIIMPSDRETLHEKINQRFQKMLQQGFLEEVEKLFKRKELHADLPAMRAVGYRQAWQYLSGEISYKNMLDKIPIVTRQLAKRQLTWLRSWGNAELLDADDFKLQENVNKLISEKWLY